MAKLKTVKAKAAKAKAAPDASWAKAKSATKMSKLVAASFVGRKPETMGNRRLLGLSALACLRVVWAALPAACRAVVVAAEDILSGEADACGLGSEMRAELESARRDVAAMRTVADVPPAVVLACEAVLAATAPELQWFESWRQAIRLSGQLGAGGRGDSEATLEQKASRARAMRLVWGGRMAPASAPALPAFAASDAAQVGGMALEALGPDADPLARLALADRLEEAGYADEAELGFLRDGRPVWHGSWLAERLSELAVAS